MFNGRKIIMCKKKERNGRKKNKESAWWMQPPTNMFFFIIKMKIEKWKKRAEIDVDVLMSFKSVSDSWNTWCTPCTFAHLHTHYRNCYIFGSVLFFMSAVCVCVMFFLIITRHCWLRNKTNNSTLWWYGYRTGKVEHFQ